MKAECTIRIKEWRLECFLKRFPKGCLYYYALHSNKRGFTIIG